MKRHSPETEAKEPDERDGIEVMRQWSRDDDAELKALLLSEPEENAPGAGAVSGTPAASSIPAGVKKFPLLSIRDFINGQRQSWYLKSLIPKNGQGQIFGESGAGKSYVALDLAYALATGRNWFKWHYSLKAKQNLPLCVYVVLEGVSGFRLRLDALIQRETKNPNNSNPEPSNLVLWELPFNIKDSVDRSLLVESILSLAGEKGVIVFIDTQAAASPALDENSSKEMGELLESTNSLQRALSRGNRDTFIFLIAHAGKVVDAKKGARGWSGQKAPLDVQIAVERTGSNSSAPRKVTLAKSKDAVDGESFLIMLQSMVVGHDEDGEPETACTVESFDGVARIVLSDIGKNGLRWLVAAYKATGKKLGEAVTAADWRKACMDDTGYDNKTAHNKTASAKKALQKADLIKSSDAAGADIILDDKYSDLVSELLSVSDSLKGESEIQKARKQF